MIAEGVFLQEVLGPSVCNTSSLILNGSNNVSYSLKPVDVHFVADVDGQPCRQTTLY